MHSSPQFPQPSSSTPFVPFGTHPAMLFTCLQDITQESICQWKSKSDVFVVTPQRTNVKWYGITCCNKMWVWSELFHSLENIATDCSITVPLVQVQPLRMKLLHSKEVALTLETHFIKMTRCLPNISTEKTTKYEVMYTNLKIDFTASISKST